MSNKPEVVKWAEEIVEEQHSPPMMVIATDILSLWAEYEQLQKAATEVIEAVKVGAYVTREGSLFRDLEAACVPRTASSAPVRAEFPKETK